MFDKNIIIKGHHATYMKKLVSKFDSSLSQGIFDRNLDVYLIAPIVGKLFNRKSVVDNDVKDDTSIHTEQINSVMDQLEFNYRIIMMLEDKEKVDIETRTNKAFRYDRDIENRKSGDAIFEQYVLGGIEVLYEKIMLETNDTDEYLRKMYQFISEFYNRYFSEIDNEDIYKLCKLAGS
ncbi:MAG: hypothetical protein AAGU76_11305 [Sedimentibacter sp.]|uniref:hypothetical protein n=1 Tax=Sedimentibacter sp. TaxID=1960295 RepID=UPI003157FD12